MKQARFLCGVDVGGTFTDIVLIDLELSSVTALKIPTTADNPSEAILNGIARLHEGGEFRSGARLVHATTLITNALIERRGARVGLLTTAGFKDVLDMRRENRFDIFDLRIRFPKALVPLEHRWELSARMDSDGAEVEPFVAAEVRDVAAQMRAAGI